MNVRQLAGRVDPGQGVPSQGSPPSRAPDTASPPGPTFAETLRRAREHLSGPPEHGPPHTLTLSAHAQQRIAQRAISMTDAEQRAIADAMDTLGQKGAQDALLLRSDAAFIVNVPNRTVVTALGSQDLQQRVFTQIDSAALL